MRLDSIGMFWEDEVKVKAPPKEKIKRTPPDPVWLSPDYLPNIETAIKFRPNMAEPNEWALAAQQQHPLVFDIECYPNYFLIAFENVVTGKQIYFEMIDDDIFHIDAVKWLLTNFPIISFNGDSYDIPLITVALSGKYKTKQLHGVSQKLIFGDGDGRDIKASTLFKEYKVKRLPTLNHIDLIDLTALAPGLKKVGGRLHVPRMQDLPVDPMVNLSMNQMIITRWYCFNDLNNTRILYEHLIPEIELREDLQEHYGCKDLRSKSRAQVAEAVIGREVAVLLNLRDCPRAGQSVEKWFHYNIPSFIKFQTPNMQWVLEQVKSTVFKVSDYGDMQLPDTLSGLKIPIGNGVYRMGIGGLHSSEKNISYRAENGYILRDRDVTSYYPYIILNQQLYPSHLGTAFLQVYKQIVDTRIDAKSKAKNDKKMKVRAEGLKIVINSSFGKMGNQYSLLYSPKLLIQTTLTGQLALLMLIERLELAGIQVVSANTDGVVSYYHNSRDTEVQAIASAWEKETGFQTEETSYMGLFSRDVNNYFAVKDDGTVKGKGVFSKTSSEKNAVHEICQDAVIEYMVNGTPIEQTITTCSIMTKFTCMRAVKGGAVKDGEYLGKVVRWYYAKEVTGEIVYAKNGNKVAGTDGAKPYMTLNGYIEPDIDYEWYINKTYNILKEINC